MTKRKVPFRRPSADEQTVLRQMQVKLLVRPKDIKACDQILVEHHYLHSAQLVGEQLRYAVVWQGRWLAVAAWSAPALHLKARDAFIGWSEAQRRERLPLVVNNSRLYVLPESHYPNLVSRFMKLMLGRLSADWQSVWQHPVALAESFVDPNLYRGTAYKVSGWSQLGHTRGWKRSAVDFYEPHGVPKQVWIRELEKNACVKLRAAELPVAWASALRPARPRCTAKVKELESLMARLGRDVPEFRRPQALAYPLQGMLVLIAMATFSGVSRGYEDLADYAATLSQPQLRALRFRQDPHTRRVRCPERTTFARVLAGVDAQLLQRVLLLWQEQVLGPVQDSSGDYRRQGNPPRRRGVGQRGQRQRSLAGFHAGAGRQQRNPRGPAAIGAVGSGGQDRAGRCGPHPSGAGQTDSLRPRGRLPPDGQKEPKGPLCHAGNALGRPAFFPLGPRRTPGR